MVSAFGRSDSKFASATNKAVSEMKYSDIMIWRIAFFRLVGAPNPF